MTKQWGNYRRVGKQQLLSLCMVLFLFGVGCRQAQAQLADSVKVYIDSALYLMQTKSLNSQQLDWKTITDSAYIKAKEARTYKEAFPALVYAFSQLKDHHGMVANGQDFYRYPPPVNFDEVLSPGIKKEFLKGNRIVTAYIQNQYAYLRVPGMHVTKQEDIDREAAMLRDSLCALLNKNPKGLIIDLRMNVGGNSAPMQSGLGPLFQQPVLGYSVDREGNFTQAIRLIEGVAADEKGTKLVSLQNTCTADPATPVAVLIGPSTVSSGEILAAFLKPQPNVELFGEATPGFCNATEGFLFMNNQGYLLLSVSKIADANKHIYQDMLVKPDVFIKNADNYDDLPADPVVKAAIAWMGKYKAKTNKASKLPVKRVNQTQ